jgi:hypothetical protein
MIKRKFPKGQTTTHKHYTENSRLSNTNPTKTGMKSGDPEGSAILVSPVTPVVLQLNDTSII